MQTQSSVYRYSDHHIRATRRSATVFALLPASFSLLILLLVILDKNWILAAILGVVSIAMSVRSFRAARSGLIDAQLMRDMRIELFPESLSFSGPDGVAAVPFDVITSIRIARRDGSVRAVSINLPSTDSVVVAGIERLDEFTAVLSRAVGEAKVGDYRWWQAHPA